MHLMIPFKCCKSRLWLRTLRCLHCRPAETTALVDAMDAAIDLVEDRKRWYKNTGQTYYRPWIILMTDGEPNAGQDIKRLAQRIKSDTANKKYVFLPIGVTGANMDILHSIEGEGNGKIPAMPLKGAKFGQLL